MKVQPVKIEFKTLYENRHLFNDDVQYNSLFISNLINQFINLIDIQIYEDLDIEHKRRIYERNTLSFNYILVKDGVYILEVYYEVGNMIHMIPLTDCFIAWENCDKEQQYLDILTIVNEG